jgi:hypothetical protein
MQKFHKQPKTKLSVRVKGWLQSPIQYEVRVPSGNWNSFFGNYEPQKFLQFDTSSCWCISVCFCVEDELEWLWKNGMFSQEAKDFFTQNKYIDSDGDFSISERFYEILGGNYDNGGTAEEACQLIQKYGIIPRSMLTYTEAQAQKFYSKAAFNADYFDKTEITQLMRTLGQASLKYINVAYQKIGKQWTTPASEIIQAALKQAPLAIGIPIPNLVYNWNTQPVIQYDGAKRTDHEVELYAKTDVYNIFDSYLPNLKKLAGNYLIASCTQIIISATPQMAPNTVPQPSSYWVQFWTGCMHFWNNIFDSTVPIGKA